MRQHNGSLAAKDDASVGLKKRSVEVDENEKVIFSNKNNKSVNISNVDAESSLSDKAGEKRSRKERLKNQKKKTDLPSPTSSFSFPLYFDPYASNLMPSHLQAGGGSTARLSYHVVSENDQQDVCLIPHMGDELSFM